MLAVGGMTCAACSSAVEMALQAVPGVQRVTVALATGDVEVVFHPNQLGPLEGLVTAVEDAGFEALLVGRKGLESARLEVGGMTCGACSSAVEAALGAVPGVTSASVNVITGEKQGRWVGKGLILKYGLWMRHT